MAIERSRVAVAGVQLGKIGWSRAGYEHGLTRERY